MKAEVFAEQMIRLEVMFNGGVELVPNRRDEYFRALMYVETEVFSDAVDYVLETFKPYGSEPFPSPSVLESAVIEVRSETGEEASREARDYSPTYLSKLDYCQRCDNLGLYLAEDGQARFCRCEKGRIKRVSWHIEPGVRKREERIQKALEKLPSSQGPVHGLHEWNLLGFWEDIQEEYDRWMAAKKEEIEEIKKRQGAQPEKKPTPSDELRFKSIQDTVAKIKFRERFPAPAEREPGEDEENDEVPF